MILRNLITACLALASAATLHAQDNCPMEATKHVPMDISKQPGQNCGGLNWSIGGIQVTSVRDSCPLFVIITPAHEIAVQSKNRTMVEPIATLAVKKQTFACDNDYFLFFHIGSSCSAGEETSVGLVHRMVTRSCAMNEAE